MRIGPELHDPAYVDDTFTRFVDEFLLAPFEPNRSRRD